MLGQQMHLLATITPTPSILPWPWTPCPPPLLRPFGLTCFISPPSLCLRGVFACRMKRSDIISKLEIGRPEDRRAPNGRVNGIFWILLINIGIYVADHLFQVREIKALYLYHSRPAWYQFVTSTFCHANWNHLSSNLFFLYIFGKLVEEDEGNFGLWISYILTGAGANLVSWLLLPRAAVSLGASGAVFGLFAISVLVKMSLDWRKILEVLILGQFVIEKVIIAFLVKLMHSCTSSYVASKPMSFTMDNANPLLRTLNVECNLVMEAAQASAGIGSPMLRGSSLLNINHIAHLSGALFGAALVLLVSRIPSQGADQETKPSREEKDTRK